MKELKKSCVLCVVQRQSVNGNFVNGKGATEVLFFVVQCRVKNFEGKLAYLCQFTFKKIE